MRKTLLLHYGGATESSSPASIMYSSHLLLTALANAHSPQLPSRDASHPILPRSPLSASSIPVAIPSRSRSVSSQLTPLHRGAPPMLSCPARRRVAARPEPRDIIDHLLRLVRQEWVLDGCAATPA